MNKTFKIIGSLTIVVIALAGVGLWWFFDDDAPAEVSLAAATEQLTDDSVDGTTTTTAQEDVSSTEDSSPTDIGGTWTVDTGTGDFDYESATGSFVGFRIEEELASIGSTTAVGRTGDVSGTLTIDGATLTEATFDVDVTTITTNDSRRDSRVQSALDSDNFATAQFALTEPIELGDGAASGEPISVTATGDLTIHGVTQTVQIDLDAQLVDGTIVLVGSMDLTFSDYDVEVPAAQIVVSVDDFGVLELQLLFTQQ